MSSDYRGLVLLASVRLERAPAKPETERQTLRDGVLVSSNGQFRFKTCYDLTVDAL